MIATRDPLPLSVWLQGLLHPLEHSLDLIRGQGLHLLADLPRHVVYEGLPGDISREREGETSAEQQDLPHQEQTDLHIGGGERELHQEEDEGEGRGDNIYLYDWGDLDHPFSGRGDGVLPMEGQLHWTDEIQTKLHLSGTASQKDERKENNTYMSLGMH